MTKRIWPNSKIDMLCKEEKLQLIKMVICYGIFADFENICTGYLPMYELYEFLLTFILRNMFFFKLWISMFLSRNDFCTVFL